MTREEKQKAIDALKKSAPVMAVTQEEFNDYIQILNKVMDWLEHDPCEDAVSRVWIREHLGEFLRGCRAERTYEEIAEDVEAYIDHAPPVTPKQRTGKWIVHMDCEGKTRCCECNRCGYKTGKYTWKNPNFCENCGADMRGGE